jgi:hypothetical protein
MTRAVTTMLGDATNRPTTKGTSAKAIVCASRPIVMCTTAISATANAATSASQIGRPCRCGDP